MKAEASLESQLARTLTLPLDQPNQESSFFTILLIFYFTQHFSVNKQDIIQKITYNVETFRTRLNTWKGGSVFLSVKYQEWMEA